MDEVAKQQAIQDIKEELKEQSKSFIAFHKRLNPIINLLVEHQIQLQEKISPKH